MDMFRGWTTQKLLEEQFRLLEKLKALTNQLSSNLAKDVVPTKKGKAQLQSESVLGANGRPRKWKYSLGPQEEAISDAPSVPQSLGIASSKSRMPSNASSRWPNEDRPLLHESQPLAQSPKITRSASRGQEARSLGRSPTSTQSISRGRSRERKPNSPRSGKSRRPSTRTAKRRQEVILADFPGLPATIVDDALSDAGWHVGQARMILTLQGQFPELDMCDIVSVLKKSEWNPANARNLLQLQKGLIASKRIPSRDDTSRGVHYQQQDVKSRSATPTPRTKDESGLRSRSVSERRKILGPYGAASEPPLKAGEVLIPRRLEREWIPNSNQFSLRAGPDVEDLGFAPEVLPTGEVIAVQIPIDSWAHSLGLCEGDELLRLNGTSVRNMLDEDFVSVLDERPLSLVFASKTSRTF